MGLLQPDEEGELCESMEEKAIYQTLGVRDVTRSSSWWKEL